MSNHSGSYQSNTILHALVDTGVFATLSKEQSLTILRALRDSVDDGNLGEIFEDVPESLKYCVECHAFYDEVRYTSSYGMTLCKSCFEELGEDWDEADESGSSDDESDSSGD